MKYTLTINDPKTGWANAEDLEVTSPEQAYELVSEYWNKNFEYSLTVSNETKYLKSFILICGKDHREFKGTSDNQPLSYWLTQFEVKP